jgi:hypothetical protein
MIAYKFLRAGGVGPFSGYSWPLPSDGQPGEWVEARRSPSSCTAGVHACAIDDLPVWLGAELWRAELDGEVVRHRTKLVAQRGRLVERVSGWDDEAAREFARACAARAREHAKATRGSPERIARAEAYAGDAEVEAESGRPATVAYIAARAAAHTAEDRAAIGAERVWQSRWLAERLGL